MKRTLWKDTFREIRHSISRFLAILFIILIGVAFYVGIRSAGPDMLATANKYYREQNLMDGQVISTIGLEADDLEAIEDILDENGGGKLTPQITQDVIFEETKQTVRLYSLADVSSDHSINRYHISAGRLPQAPHEIALDDAHHFAAQFELGDTITIADDFVKATHEKISDDKEFASADMTQGLLLTQHTFQVVGFVRSPLFIEEPTRGNSLVGGGKLNAFAVILPEAFDTKRYTDVYFTLDQLMHEAAYSTSYKDRRDDFIELLEQKLERRAADKQDEISGTLEEEIQKGEEALQEARTELDDARQKLIQAEAELKDARDQLNAGQIELNNKRQAGRQQLDDAWDEWQRGADRLEDGRIKLQEGKDEWNAAAQFLEQKSDELTQLEAGLKAIAEGEEALAAAQEELAQNEKSLNEKEAKRPQLTAFLKQMEQLGVDQLHGFTRSEILQQLKQLDQARQQLEDAKQQLNQQQAELAAKRQALNGYTPEQLEALRTQLQANEKNLAQKQKELEAKANEFAEQEQKISIAKQTLIEQSALFDDQIAAAEANLAAQEEKWAAGKATLDEQKATFERQSIAAENEIAENEAKLNDAKALLKDLPTVRYIINDRDDNPGYTEYEDNAARINAIAGVLPIFFFFIAILISLTTMTRMVDEEREYIGIMKAMGYRRQEIALKFIVYAFLATTLGAAMGLFIGYPLFPQLIYNSYRSLYNLPDIQLDTYPLFTATALFASYLATVFATLLAVLHSLRLSAAQLLRPKAPKEGQRILLEKITPLWERLSFNYKITFRNLFRYKTRMLMTIFGVAGSCGLILTGFGLSDSVIDIPNLQFDELSHYQAIAALKEADEADRATLEHFLQSEEAIQDTLSITTMTAKTEKKGMNTQQVTLYAVQEPERLPAFIQLQDSKTKKPLPLTDGTIYITTKLAELLGIKAGDTLTIESTDRGSFEFEISGIAENYLGHFLYMTAETYTEITNQPAEPNLKLIQYDTKQLSATEFGEKLLKQPAIMGISNLNDVKRSFTDTIDSLNIITHVLVISAALLAFTVLYNLTNINVAERIRELSTIKVLGFYDREVTAYIYRENIFLTLMGIVAGYGFGYLLHGFLIRTTEVDMMRFSRHISWQSYAMSALLTFTFATLVMFIVHRKLKHINMVDALKGGD
ncbi:FtsX-like permease family protein [Allofustis seminis]|uniref:FtsX-like permease family protein n=1 Tax=Allofustis seminis TaxID=166939 RepID=UPI000399B8BB|nr:FtsX-like permease family protein [Allofustis seminis]